MRNLLLLAALVGAAFAAPAAQLEQRDVVWDVVVVTKTVTITAGQAGPTSTSTTSTTTPPAPTESPADVPAPEHHTHLSHTTAAPAPIVSAPSDPPPAPKPTTASSKAPAPAAAPPPSSTAAAVPKPASTGSSSPSSNSCPTFPGMSNPLTGASESYCCTESAPCGIAQAAGAEASFYQMAGGTGACGQSLPDSAMFVAVNAEIMGSLSSGNPGNPLCGKTVVVKNTQNGKTAQGTVADKCPGCKTSFGIDLSEGVFNQLADESQGVFPVEWWFTDL